MDVPPTDRTGATTGLTRRRFLKVAGAGTAAAWLARTPWSVAAESAPPAGFPAGIEVYRETFENWAGEHRVEDVWTCAPRSADDVVAVASWALRTGHTVRPRGMRHNWSPLVVPPGGGGRTVLVDTTRYLTSMRTGPGSMAVTVQTGATMGALLAFLEERGQGFTSVPSTGEVSVGGVLAIDGHGAAVPARGEPPPVGRTHGSLANRVLSLTAVVWDGRRRRYALRTFPRHHPDTKSLLTHLGRTFVTEVTLRAEPNQNVRCESLVDVPASELFADPRTAPAGARTFQSFMDRTGRIEAIWYAFTDHPWVKVWSESPAKPADARVVTSPYNYPFSDNLPDEVANLAGRLVKGGRRLTPMFGRSMYAVTVAGLRAGDAHDIWGPSKNVLLYIRPSTLRVTAFGLAVTTRRRDVQRVVSAFARKFRTLLEVYAARDRFPVNLGLECRVTGLNAAPSIGVAGAQPPALSSIAPRSDRPEWDTVVWLNLVTLPGTPHANEFFRTIEAWAFRTFGRLGTVRPEWAKGWAYTDTGAWTDRPALTKRIPDAFRVARRRDEDWEWTIRTFDKHDPHRIFSNPFLDRLLR